MLFLSNKEAEGFMLLRILVVPIRHIPMRLRVITNVAQLRYTEHISHVLDT